MNYGTTRCRSTMVVIAALAMLSALSLSAQTAVNPPSGSPFWAQWGLNPQHTLNLSQTAGQPLNKNLVNIIYDANVAQEQADPNAPLPF